MLAKEEKINIFKEYLDKENSSYADAMKDKLNFYFFQNEYSLDFLNSLVTKNEIINKTDLLVSKMIMYENEDSLDNIIETYI